MNKKTLSGFLLLLIVFVVSAAQVSHANFSGVSISGGIPSPSIIEGYNKGACGLDTMGQHSIARSAGDFPSDGSGGVPVFPVPGATGFFANFYTNPDHYCFQDETRWINVCSGGNSGAGGRFCGLDQVDLPKWFYYANPYESYDTFIVPDPNDAVVQNDGFSITTTATLVANPASITSGDSSALTWSSDNASSCTGTGFSTGGATSGTVAVSPSTTTNYSVTCTGPNNSPTAAATVTVVNQLPDLTASLTPAQLNLTAVTGQPITLTATVSNIGSGPTGVPFATTFWTNTTQNMTGPNVQYTEFTSGIPNGFPANYSETDGQQLPVTRTFNTPGTYYYQVCADLDNNWNRTVAESNNNNDCTAWGTITVVSPTVSCSPSTASGSVGQNITWTPSSSGFASTPTYSWTGVGGNGTPSSGSGATFTNSYGSSGNYSVHVVATQGGSSANADCSSTVISPSTLTVTATPTRVQQGTGGVSVSWSSTNATACTITGNGNTWTGTSGTQTDPNPITAQTKYSGICTTSGSPVSASAVVNVAPTFNNF